MGAATIMSNLGAEAADLAALGGSLLVNMGTITPDGLANQLEAIEAYHKAKRRIVFDPVGYAHPHQPTRDTADHIVEVAPPVLGALP